MISDCARGLLLRTEFMPGTVNLERFITKEVIGKLLPVFLNGHILKLPAKYLCLCSRTSSVFALIQKGSLCSKQGSIPGCLRYQEQVTVEW